MQGDVLLGSSFADSAIGNVYSTLIASLDGWTGNVAPGASATLARILDRLRMRGDSVRVERLQQICVDILRLQQAAARGDAHGQSQARHALRRAARTWLEEAPMFPAGGAAAPTLRAA